MTGIGAVRAALLVVISSLAVIWPRAARAEDSVDDKLDTVLILERRGSGRNRQLDDAVADLAKRMGVAIKVDDAAFRQEKIIYNGGQTIKFLGRNVRGRTALEWVLDQADVRYEVRDKTVMIIPKTRGGKDVPFAPAKTKLTEQEKAYKKAAIKIVDIERPIDASMRDVLEFLEDRFDLTILVDECAFSRNRNKKNVSDSRIKMPVSSISLSHALGQLSQQVDGTFEIRDDHFRITAKPKK